MCMHVWLMPTAFLRRQRTFSDGSMQASGLQNPRLDCYSVFFHRHCFFSPSLPTFFFFFFFHICPSCNISPGSENAVNKLNTGRKYTQMQKNGCWHLWETVKQNVLLFFLNMNMDLAIHSLSTTDLKLNKSLSIPFFFLNEMNIYSPLKVTGQISVQKCDDAEPLRTTTRGVLIQSAHCLLLILLNNSTKHLHTCIYNSWSWHV